MDRLNTDNNGDSAHILDVAIVTGIQDYTCVKTMKLYLFSGHPMLYINSLKMKIKHSHNILIFFEVAQVCHIFSGL